MLNSFFISQLLAAKVNLFRSWTNKTGVPNGISERFSDRLFAFYVPLFADLTLSETGDEKGQILSSFFSRFKRY